jgi:hypothetical protein
LREIWSGSGKLVSNFKSFNHRLEQVTSFAHAHFLTGVDASGKIKQDKKIMFEMAPGTGHISS